MPELENGSPEPASAATGRSIRGRSLNPRHALVRRRAVSPAPTEPGRRSDLLDRWNQRIGHSATNGCRYCGGRAGGDGRASSPRGCATRGPRGIAEHLVDAT